MVSGTELTREDEEDIKDALDVLGLTAGWGAEYFFSPQFSLGGEASLNWIFHDVDYRGEYGESSTQTKTTLTASLVRLTFNFYFR
jgi:hypothetical protein